MPTPRVRPLLLLDVDGPLNPYRRLHTHTNRRTGQVRHRHDAPPQWVFYDDVPTTHPRTGETEVTPFLLNPDHGPALLDLTRPENGGFTLVWATTWEAEANRVLAPRLGLPDLPVVPFPDSARPTGPARARHRGSWKTPTLAAWLDVHAPGTPWAWVDDEANRYDRTWFDNHYRWHPSPVPFLVRHVDPHHGLRPTDFAALTEWARHLPDPEDTLTP